MDKVKLFDSRVLINLTSFSALQRAGINNNINLLNIIKEKDQLKAIRNIWKEDIEKIWNYIKRNNKE